MTTVEYMGLEERVFGDLAQSDEAGSCGGFCNGGKCGSKCGSKCYNHNNNEIPLRPTLPKITTNTTSLLEMYVSTVGTKNVTPEEVSLLTKLEGLDLDPIKVKLMDAEEGYDWTREQADSAAHAYKQFLFINAKYEDNSIVPTKLVDKVWHYHILDTRKYAEDSQEIFGQFLHHFPYFGMRGEEDAENLKNSFAETQDLFVENFGVSQMASFDGKKNSNVSSKCLGGKCTGSACYSGGCSKCRRTVSSKSVPE